jgi:UDP-2-acetamido-3-amino-2,3-dideoxy-glucuronate N-acetyltransferase
VLRPADAAPGVVLGEGVEVGEGVQFGPHVVVGDGTRIGDGVVVDAGAVLGRPPRLSGRSRASRETPPPLEIGPGCLIGAGACVNAGAVLEADVVVADQAHVRERARIGASSVVGRAAQVDNDVTLGARVKLQSGVYVTAHSTVEDDVFVGPGVFTYNDDAMGRRAAGTPLRGVTLRRACRIGGGSRLRPGIEVGEEALVAMGAVVVHDVPARAVVMGVPARVVREVPDEDLLERWR